MAEPSRDHPGFAWIMDNLRTLMREYPLHWIVADAQQWTTRNIAHAGCFYDEHARASVSKAPVPVEILLCDDAVFSRAPRHHRRHPRPAARFERADAHGLEQQRARGFSGGRPASYFYLVSDWTRELPHLSHRLHDSGTFTSGGFLLV